MTWRRAWLYCGLFLLLASYYAATAPRFGGGVPMLPKREALFPVTARDVRGLTIEREGQTIQCAFDGSRWRVVSPPGSRAPSDLMAALVEHLTSVPDVATVAETGAEGAEFGLSPPESRLTLRLADGSETVLSLGARNPARTAVYGRVEGQPRVVLIGLNIVYYEDLIAQASRPVPG